MPGIPVEEQKDTSNMSIEERTKELKERIEELEEEIDTSKRIEAFFRKQGIIGFD